MKWELTVEELGQRALELSVGDEVSLSGVIYTARDAAHKRLFALLDAGEELPFPLKGAVIYYCGPTPAKEGQAVGACGPTTSGRMDRFAPRLYDLGLLATVGKGERNEAVYESICRNGALYLCAIGGAGAFYSSRVKACEVVAFPELGCESIKKLWVQSLPLIVGAASQGETIYHKR